MRPDLEARWRLGELRLWVFCKGPAPGGDYGGDEPMVAYARHAALCAERDGRWQVVAAVHGEEATTFAADLDRLGVPCEWARGAEGRRVAHAQVGHFVRWPDRRSPITFVTIENGTLNDEAYRRLKEYMDQHVRGAASYTKPIILSGTPGVRLRVEQRPRGKSGRLRKE